MRSSSSFVANHALGHTWSIPFLFYKSQFLGIIDWLLIATKILIMVRMT